MADLNFWRNRNAQAAQPSLQVALAMLIVGVAARMI